MDYITYKHKVRQEVERRGLTSIMNDTRWEKLKFGVYHQLPFPPAFQVKYVLSAEPHPTAFEQDVNYNGDWTAILGDLSDDAQFCNWQHPSFNVEWVRVKPRRLEYRGQLVEDECIDIEAPFVALLHECNIPYLCRQHDYWIYGYATATEFAQLRT
ncbi:DUF6678 family protein [Paenibacillus sp. WLX1005]|uniref:DUF6678 family protein n=1 Tax=unclassified Paenibacillus TaxID=185978 RepID=UPI0039840875